MFGIQRRRDLTMELQSQIMILRRWEGHAGNDAD
ncbi:unnamed protein product [Arabidopsis lyrata]|nr:unnamed protein product [Arabidopsis lyrata]